MKSRILGVFVLLFSLAAFAGKVPQAELQNVNAFIAQLLGNYGQMVEIEVTKASRSNKTKLLTSATVEANVMGFAKVELGLKTKKKDITLTGTITAKAADIGLSADEILEMSAEANKFVAAINKKGDYKAKFELDRADQGTDIKLSMVPTKANKKPSIKNLTIKGFLPNDIEATTKISLDGTFKGGADNVVTVRESITNIFNSLSEEEMPNDSDFEALGQVIATMFKALDDLEDEE